MPYEICRTGVRISSKCFYRTETTLTEKTKITFSRNGPIILNENAISHLMAHGFPHPQFSAPGCDNQCPTPISISYMSAPLGTKCAQHSRLQRSGGNKNRLCYSFM